MWPFSKNTSVSKLYDFVKQKEKKDWEKRLNHAVKVAEQGAKEGKQFLTISDALLRCPYNKDRQRDNILDDIKKRFKGCSVFFASLHGQTTIEVRWNKQVPNS